MADTPRTPRLLGLLEEKFPPKLYGKKAWFRPQPPIPADVVKAAVVPRWSDWVYDGAALDDTVTVDVNAAWVAAASCVSWAFEALEHSGPLPVFPGWPGYYRVMVAGDEWQDRRIVHPLGRDDLHGAVWLAQPTAALLVELHRKWDLWPQLMIVDSWTCSRSVKPKEWVAHVKAERERLIDSRDHEQYARFKDSYRATITGLPGPKPGDDWNCLSRRPDWRDATMAMDAANTWRKAWKCVEAGFGPVRMGRTDELTFGHEDLLTLASLPSSPLRLDQTGKSLGTFKVKSRDTAGAGS